MSFNPSQMPAISGYYERVGLSRRKYAEYRFTPINSNCEYHIHGMMDVHYNVNNRTLTLVYEDITVDIVLLNRRVVANNRSSPEQTTVYFNGLLNHIKYAAAQPYCG